MAGSIAVPSVQSLFLELRFRGQVLGTATGFVVCGKHGYYLVTNRHNVTGRHQDTGKPLSKMAGVPDEVAIQHNALGALGSWTKTVEPLFTDSIPRWYEHPRLGSKADFVALPLSQLAGIQIYPYDLANPGPPIHVGPADSVSVVGFPFGRSVAGYVAIWASGFLASEPDLDYDQLPVMLIDCRTRPGQSGSPVIAHRSGGMVPTIGGGSAVYSGPVTRFLGIYSGRIQHESDLGFVWKASALAELMAKL